MLHSKVRDQSPASWGSPLIHFALNALKVGHRGRLRAFECRQELSCRFLIHIRMILAQLLNDCALPLNAITALLDVAPCCLEFSHWLATALAFVDVDRAPSAYTRELARFGTASAAAGVCVSGRLSQNQPTHWRSRAYRDATQAAVRKHAPDG
jgi:hypothetical protein